MNKRGTLATTRRARLVQPWLALILVGFGPVDPTDLIEAAKQGDRAAVRALVEQGADVNLTHGDGSTALHWVSFWGDHEGAALLLRAGANANASNDLGATPLWAAALNADASMTRLLLEAGADPNVSLLLGETILMQASRTGSSEVVEMLLRAGADPNARGPIQETSSCPLDGVYTFQEFQPNVIPGVRRSELERIRSGSMTCGLRAGNQTALMWAVANRHSDAVALLLEHGADVHARTDVWSELGAVGPSPIFANQRSFLHGGNTAILFAARAGDLESTMLLVEAGANVDETDAWGNSALALAAFTNSSEIVTYLLERGANPNPPESDEVLAPLHLTVMHRNAPLVVALLEHGANPNAPLATWSPRVRSAGGPGRWFNFHPASVGATPLLLAARWGTPEIVQILADHGADPFVVHRSEYYGGVAGIDAFLYTEYVTPLLAALDNDEVYPGLGDRWVRGARGRGNRAESDVLETMRVLVALGVDVNEISYTTRTCDVPWAETFRPGERLNTCLYNLIADRRAAGFIGTRTVLDAAMFLEYDAVVAYLREQGALTADEQPDRPHLGALAAAP